MCGPRWQAATGLLVGVGPARQGCVAILMPTRRHDQQEPRPLLGSRQRLRRPSLRWWRHLHIDPLGVSAVDLDHEDSSQDCHDQQAGPSGVGYARAAAKSASEARPNDSGTQARPVLGRRLQRRVSQPLSLSPGAGGTSFPKTVHISLCSRVANASVHRCHPIRSP